MLTEGILADTVEARVFEKRTAIRSRKFLYPWTVWGGTERGKKNLLELSYLSERSSSQLST